MQKVSEMKVENLDHLGLVADLIDEIGIVQKINELVGEQPDEIVSPGLGVKAMIINGLGMMSAPLYLFSKFFGSTEPIAFLRKMRYHVTNTHS